MAESKAPIKAVGPGSIQAEEVDLEPILQYATKDDFVDMKNPMEGPFVGAYGVTIPADTPFEIHQSPQAPTTTRTEGDVQAKYGLPLKNPSHQGKRHVQNTVTIQAGETIRVLGDSAKVLVKQLVDAMMQLDKRQLFLADSHARRPYEELIIQGQGRVSDLIGGSPKTYDQQLQEAIKDEPEPEFSNLASDPGENNGVNTTTVGGTDTADSTVTRKPGRPPKV